jgi:Bacterial SH3 domain
MTGTTAAMAAREIRISKQALKAFGELPDLRVSALSPLARVQSPDGAADRTALIAALAGMDGPWLAAPPALLSPGRTVEILFGDGDAARIGQYLWADPDGRGPGFRAMIVKDVLRLAGPIEREDVLLAALDLAAMPGVGELGPVAITFSLEQFWATLALFDAYRMTLLRNRLARGIGYPPGVTQQTLAEAWRTGIGRPDPGWSVSLFALLRPDLVPAGFDALAIPAIDEMDAADLLARLPGDADDPMGDVYILGPGLDDLCNAILDGVVQFGMSVQRLRAPNEIDLATVGGWRTPVGFWLADISAIPFGGTGRVVLSLHGPSSFSDLIDHVLGGNAQATDAPFEAAAQYSRDALLAALRPAAPAAKPRVSKATRAGVTAPATPGTEPATPGTEPATPGTEPATPGTEPAAAPASGWSATHTIPAEGMTAWSEPDPKSQSVAVAGGLPVAVVERRGNWARVTASNGWSGWVDGSRLP